MEYIIFLLCLLCIFLIYRDNKNKQTIEDITNLNLKLKEENEELQEYKDKWEPAIKKYLKTHKLI